MSKPEEVLWDCEPHTQAKHRLLVGYLQAWYPIMADREQSLNVIDGFAGPGRYRGGEEGSPLLMIDAFVNHTRGTPAMGRATVMFDFIELDKRRAEHLREELAALTLPSNVTYEVHQGSFDTIMAGILDGIQPTAGLAPTFAFIDPFGYTGHGLQLSSRILQFKKCEVLIYVPLPHIARFIGEPSVEAALDNLFGDSSWKAARTAKGKSAELILHELFLERVRRAAGHAISFEIDATTGRGWAGYTLYFGTSHPLGLEKMKAAMWKIDPAGGTRFAYSVDPGQMTMFESAPDLTQLETLLRGQFDARPFTIEQAARFTTLSTPFSADMHLKRKTLEVAERAGRIDASNPGKPKRHAGYYTPGTVLQFRST